MADDIRRWPGWLRRIPRAAGASECTERISTTDTIILLFKRTPQMLAPDGRVIMISGANRGIGLAIAQALHVAGYSLSLGAREPASFADVTRGWAPERLLTGRYDAEDQATRHSSARPAASRST